YGGHIRACAPRRPDGVVDHELRCGRILSYYPGNLVCYGSTGSVDRLGGWVSRPSDFAGVDNGSFLCPGYVVSAPQPAKARIRCRCLEGSAGFSCLEEYRRLLLLSQADAIYVPVLVAALHGRAAWI